MSVALGLSMLECGIGAVGVRICKVWKETLGWGFEHGWRSVERVRRR